MEGIYFIARKMQPEKMDLMKEELRKFGLLESYRPLNGNPSTKVYYGMNVSRWKEPLDQFDVLLLISRLKRAGLDMQLSVFIAGRYGQLNGRSAAELIEGEKKKVQLFQDAMLLFGLQPADKDTSVYSTDYLWSNKEYWKQVLCKKDILGIIDTTRRGRSFREVIASFEKELQAKIPDALIESLGDIDAPALYRLLEVSEASFFTPGAKIGPAFEQEYDCYIGQFMDIIQLRQPLDFKSRPGCLKPVTPYIGKQNEQRIFLEDSKEEIAMKVRKLAQRASGQPLFSEGFLNPFVRTAILATEAAAMSDSAPVSFDTRRASDGATVLDFFEKAGTDRLQKYASVVVECLWAYLVLPMKRMGIYKEAAA
jgi:hypothetical protein